MADTYHQTNLFYLNHNPTLAAEALLDLHVTGLVSPITQMLTNVYHMEGALHPPPLRADGKPYAPDLTKHPCSIWLCEEFKHWQWGFMHVYAMAQEFEYRFGQKHPDMEAIHYLSDHRPTKWMSGRNFWDPPLVVPADFKTRINGAMASYRTFYRLGCRQLHRWTRRTPPLWLVELRDAQKRVTTLIDEAAVDLEDMDSHRAAFKVNDDEWREVKRVAVSYANGLDAITELDSEAEHLLELSKVVLVEPNNYRPEGLTDAEWAVITHIATERLNGRDPLEEPREWNYTDSRV